MKYFFLTQCVNFKLEMSLPILLIYTVNFWLIILIWCYIIKGMQLLSRKSKLMAHILSMPKNIQTFSYQTYSNRRQFQNPVPKKAYQILLSDNDIGQLPKLPSAKHLNILRSKQISRIMVFNHQINHQQVFESHIQCFYSIISRFQPSIEGMALLVEQIYRNLTILSSQNPQARFQGQNRALIPIMKAGLLGKLAKISYAIQPYYNEYMKMMLATFMTKAILFSQSSQLKKRQQYAKIQKLREQVDKNGKEIFIKGQKIAPLKLQSFFQQKMMEIDQAYPILQLIDYFEGCIYILRNEYYNQEFLSSIVSKLQKHGLEDKENLKLTILKVKTIGLLNKFQIFQPISSKKDELQTLYNQNVKRYFEIISDAGKLFQMLYSGDQIIQNQLIITQFLSNEHFNQAKELYFNIFNQMFDTNQNGFLMIDIKKIRSIFEIILIMSDYRDTNRIHDFIRKVEKVISIYTFSIMQRIQTLCYVCQKFGYKSDLLAEKYFDTLIKQKEKLTNLKGIIPLMHQYTRELNLARKFVTYLEIVQKGTEEHLQLAHKYASELFDPNIWYCLAQKQINTYTYFNTPSFNSFLYFTKISVNNLTSGFQQKKRIATMAQKIKLRNINKKHNSILIQIQNAMKLTPTKLNHTSFWRHNHHSRIAATLKLAIHNYKYLLNRDHQEASSFLSQFLKKSINSTYFYNAFKQSMAYGSIFNMMLELMQYVNAKSFPIQNQDLQALKRLFSKNLQKLKKMQQKQLSKKTNKIKYTQFLDVVEHYRIYLPYNQQHYGLSGTPYNLENSLIYDSIICFKEYKQRLKIQIQTYCKYKQISEVQVILNHLEYPHIADVYLKRKDKTAVIMVDIADDTKNRVLNYKQIQMQRQAEQFWKKKGAFIIHIKTKAQIQQFQEQRIKDLFNKLQHQKI